MMGANGKLDLGDILEAYCPACRLNLDASVAALLPDGAVAKVQCRTCGNFHEFKAPVPDDVRRERGMQRAMNMRRKRTYVPDATIKRGGKVVVQMGNRPPDSPVSQVAVAPAVHAESRSEWEKVTAGVGSTQASLYREQRKYRAGDYLIHKKHGFGYVKEVRQVEDGEWAVVVFRDLTETLPVGRP
jgi:hypothetical protein